ncbi:hypothetical protein [Posidoniimonas polymericola]|uniref:hypothetical protein n=1 Tax=Posidoniimonas polymericola TaxID=2528002 RepID=UPI0011B7EEFF|nr:hypothetical protein [Posidoniimonas polymericola]
MSTALWLLTCAALFFGGYRMGRWQNEAPPEAVVVKSYYAADLVAANENGAPGPLALPDLVAAVAVAIEGDPGVEVRGFEKNNSFIAAATSEGHEQIEGVLAAFREVAALYAIANRPDRPAAPAGDG